MQTAHQALPHFMYSGHRTSGDNPGGKILKRALGDGTDWGQPLR